MPAFPFRVDDRFCSCFCCSDNVQLQGEHGTGRNVAPYVEMEWGTKAYEIMWRLKELFDPEYVLNPGVVLNKVCLLVFVVIAPGCLNRSRSLKDLEV